jgi:hypothetical protein
MIRKANTLNARDHFKFDGDDNVYVLQYDAYYPDPYGTDVALIYKLKDTTISQSCRIHGQTPILTIDPFHLPA